MKKNNIRGGIVSEIEVKIGDSQEEYILFENQASQQIKGKFIWDGNLAKEIKIVKFDFPSLEILSIDNVYEKKCYPKFGKLKFCNDLQIKVGNGTPNIDDPIEINGKSDFYLTKVNLIEYDPQEVKDELYKEKKCGDCYPPAIPRRSKGNILIGKR